MGIQVVNAGLDAIAHLIGGDTALNAVTTVGFGSGTGAPAITDTGLSGRAYYRAFDSIEFLGAGVVRVHFTLSGAVDWGALGMTVGEIGLFANPSAVGLPAAISTGGATWLAAHAYVLGEVVVDSASNIQVCTAAGTSGASAPAWATTIAGATPDGAGTLVWTCRALHTAPTLLYGRAAVGMGLVVAGTANVSHADITV